MNIRRTVALAIAALAGAAGLTVTVAPAHADTVTKHSYECRLTKATPAGYVNGIVCSSKGDASGGGETVGAFVVDDGPADTHGTARTVVVCSVVARPAAEVPASVSNRWPECRDCRPVNAEHRAVGQVTPLADRGHQGRPAERGAPVAPNSEHGYQHCSYLALSIPHPLGPASDARFRAALATIRPMARLSHSAPSNH